MWIKNQDYLQKRVSRKKSDIVKVANQSTIVLGKI
jgi:DNA-directed RNA polymerase subunit H (RpoH/RPB5)